MQRTFRLFILFLLLLVLILAGLNVALNLPAVQRYISAQQPEKLQVRWDRATMVWPGKLSFSRFEAEGSTKNMQWKAAAASAKVDVSVFALINRRLIIDSTYLQSPSASLKPIESPDTNQLKRMAQKGSPAKNSWYVLLEDLLLSGPFTLETDRLRVKGDGKLSTTLSYDQKENRIAMRQIDTRLSFEQVDFEGASLLTGGTMAVSGTLPETTIDSLRGKRAINQLQLEGEMGLEMASLKVLDPWLNRFKGIKVAGKGRLAGPFRMERGRLFPGTQLAVDAAGLSIDLAGYSAAGSGNLTLSVDETEPDTAVAAIRFDEMQVTNQAQPDAALFSGRDLEIRANAPATIIPERTTLEEGILEVRLPQVVVDDIARYQAFIPNKLPFHLIGGSGVLSGEISVRKETVSAKFTLKADSASVRFNKLGAETNLEIVLSLAAGSGPTTELDISGTAVRLYSTRFLTENAGSADAFNTSLEILRGSLRLAQQESMSFSRPLAMLNAMQQENWKALIDQSDADLELVGDVSDLDWLNRLIRNQAGFAIEGAGGLSADIALRQGELEKGSKMAINPRKLAAKFLDYRVEGNGSIEALVEVSGKKPDLRITLRVDEGELTRQGDNTSFAEVSGFELDARIGAVDFDSPPKTFRFDLRLPDTRIPDMARYNVWLPATSGLTVTGGMASARADLSVTNARITGFVGMKTDGLAIKFGEQSVGLELAANLRVQDGAPAAMHFDLAGSNIVIDRIKVNGSNSLFGVDAEGNPAEPWRAELRLSQGDVVWRKPLSMDLDASLVLQDTRPFLALLANQGKRRDWLEKLLSIENVTGRGTLSVNDDKVKIPGVLVQGGNVRVGAKALFETNKREAMLYARYKKVNGVLKIDGARRNFDIFGARKQFDAWTPGVSSSPLPKNTGTASENFAHAPTVDAAETDSNQQARRTAKQDRESERGQ